MDTQIFSYLFILILVIAMIGIAKYIRGKLSKPNYDQNVQTPGTFDQLIIKLITAITLLSGLLTILGAVMGEVEMTIVFLVLTLFFAAILWLLRYSYDMSYQETEDYFIFRKQKKEYKVFYKDIVDWQPDLNEIGVLDQSRADGKYVNVNISVFKTEILLRKIAEMTFAGQFKEIGNPHIKDSTRENELIHFLKQYNYQDLIEDDIKQ